MTKLLAPNQKAYFCIKLIEMEFSIYQQTPETIAGRIDAIVRQELSPEALMQAWKIIFSCIDLTTLEATDNNQRIHALCRQALDFASSDKTQGVAAICVYMPFVALGSHLLKNSGIKVATVSCCFPSGQLPLHLKLAETSWASAQGADEIDMVISRGLMLEGQYNAIEEEVRAVKAACGSAHLKVILETGELAKPEIIRKASELALLAGADFLKTSTGKVQPAATPEAAVVMLDTIKEYYELTGKKVGFKPAGGIAEPETALIYYKLVKSILGEDWLNPTLFRVGASRLATRLFDLIV
ncbi:MAG TPA: deoxyribose-phosphate aldolase [Bacteroidales bacterium]|nr:deoxyribose-phosphate aldolase [Bacteroidales bacterium]